MALKKRYLQVFTLFFTGIIALLWYSASLKIFSSLILLSIILLLVLFKEIKIVGIALLALLTGFINFHAHNYLYQKNSSHCFTQGVLKGLVEEIPRQAAYNSWHFVLYNSEYGKLQINTKTGLALPNKGDFIVLKGHSSPINLSQNNYFRSQGLKGKIIAEEIVQIQNPSSLGGHFLQFLGNAQIQLTNIHKVLLPKEKANLMIAMLIGSQNLSRELRILGQNLGVAHLFAASALNLTALAWFLNYLANIFKLGRMPKTILILSAITLYSLIAGWGPSISRAWFMAVLVIVGQLAQRKANLLNILLFSLLISLLLDCNLIGDLGFQFSYLATLGLILWTEKLIDKFNFVPRSWAEPIAITIAAEALILPLQFLYFQNIPLYANLANIIAVPLGNGILIFGLLSSLFSVLGSLGWQIAVLIEFIAGGFINLFLWWLNLLSNFPASDLKLESIAYPFILWLYALIIYLGFGQKNKIFKHFLMASFAFLLLWINNSNYLTLISLSKPWSEGLFIKTKQGAKIFICHGSKFEGADLQKLSIHSLDWWIGDCPKPNNFLIKHSSGLNKKTKLQINKDLNIQIAPSAVLILYENFSALILFKPLMNRKPNQFYSLVKFAYTKPESKNIIWSQSPKAEFYLMPHLAKKQREETDISLKPLGGQILHYLEMKNKKFYTDGMDLIIEKPINYD